MRLQKVKTGHRLPQKALLWLIGLTGDVDDIVRLLLYRSAFFGRPFAQAVQIALRGPSDWSVGERELLAAFVSRLNQCPFCAGSHGAVAAVVLGDALVQAALEDWRTAPVGERLRAILGFLEQLTHTPDSVTPETIAPLRAVDISDAAIADAIAICALFGIINRLANALEFKVPSPAAFARGAPALLKRGYRA